MDVNKVTPVQRMQLPRYTAHSGWTLSDISVDSTRVALSGYNRHKRTTSIDLFTLDVSGSTPLTHQRPIFSQEFPPDGDSIWPPSRYVSLIDGDSSHIVTVCRSQLDLYNIHSNDDHRTVTYRDRKATSVAVSETGDIYISLYHSNKVIVFDGELNIIKSITLNGMEEDECILDITVKKKNLFISTSIDDKALRYSMDGELLNEYNEPDQQRSQAVSIAVSSEAGLVFVFWWWWGCGHGRRVVAVYSLADGNYLFKFDADVNPGRPRIRLSNINRLVTANEEGELIVYNTSQIYPFNFESLKEILSDFLSSNDCQQLGNFFELSSQEVDAVSNSQSPVKDLINALEEREIVHSANINRLLHALCHLKLSEKAVRSVELYKKYNGEETPYKRFLAALSSHLTLSVPGKLCEYFKVIDVKKNKVSASQSSGLTLLTVLDEMGLIHQFDVTALISPLRKLQLVQAVAKVEAYQSLVKESKQMKKIPISTLEAKRMMFIECVRKKIKTWYETMTPVPWKNSCKWTSSELFVSCSLILTGTSEELKVGNIDPDCELQYRDIFTHDRLQSETRIIIEGGPGSGKTMLLSKLAYDWSINNIHDVNIVIFLPLMFVKDMTIFEAIEKFYVPSDVPLNADDIESLLNQASEENKAFILLDGLEVYNRRPKDKEPPEVVKVMKKEKLSNCRVVLSSCSDFEQDLFECPRLRLRQFSEEERDMYIDTVFSDNKEKQETFKNAIKSSVFLQDLCTTPLLLVFVVHNLKYFVQYESSDQQESLGALMQALIDTLHFHAHLDDREQSQSQVQSASLSEIAFNGLCKGYRQLHWQKSFLDRTVSDMKAWTESGILVSEDDLLVREEQQPEHHAETIKQISTSAFVYTGEFADALIWKKIESQNKSILGTSERNISDLSDSEAELLGEEQREVIPSRQSVYEGKVKQHQTKEMLDTEKLLISGTSESEVIDVIGKGKLNREDRILSSSSGIERKPWQHVSDQRKTVTSRLHQKETSSTHLHNVSLQIKFLHEVIQEWFAAIHISYMLKHADKDNQEVFLNKHLPLINPADLQYVLRFTSYLYPDCCHLIMEHLFSVYKQEDGAVPEYILNCIFLCFAEVDSSARDEKMENVVRQVCKNTVTIRGEDSRLLQQSKVLMLTYASDAEIDIKHLKLVNVVAEISELVMTFNSDLTLPTLAHLQMIEVCRWDQKLQKEDYKNLMVFLSKCLSLEEAQCTFPNFPPKFTHKQLFPTIQENMTVKWNIGKNVRFTLNKETEMWKPEFRIPASKSGASGKLATQLTVNETGGMLSIPDTGVKLEIPPGALIEATLIRMRIIPHHFQDDRPLSFGSNSSAVVELLPSKLKLLKPTKLTLPHCLILKKGLKWKARVFSSHHEEGKSPQWVEEKNTYSELKSKTCLVWLHNFSWKTFDVANGEIVVAMKILLYAARRPSSTDTTVVVDVGYFVGLLKALEHTMSAERKVLLDHHPAPFYRDGKKPLNILFEKTKPNTWMCVDSEKKRDIPFNDCVVLENDYCKFVFKKKNAKKGRDCTCYFKAGQRNMKELSFSLQKTPPKFTTRDESTNTEKDQPQLRQYDERPMSLHGATMANDDTEEGCEAKVASSSTGLQRSSSQTKKESRKRKKKRSEGSEWSANSLQECEAEAASSSTRLPGSSSQTEKESKKRKKKRSKSSEWSASLQECEAEAASSSTGLPGSSSQTEKESRKRKKKRSKGSEWSASLQKPSLAAANLSKLPLPEEPPSEKRHDDQQRSISSQGASPNTVVVDDSNLRECGTSTVVEAASNSSEVTGLPSKTKKKKRKKKKARRSESSASSQVEQSKDHKLDEVPTNPTKKTKLDCPVDEPILWKIAQRIPNKWRGVGRNLRKVKEHDIENVTENYGPQKERAYQILLLWKRQNGEAAKYSELKEALERAGRKDVSDELLP